MKKIIKKILYKIFRNVPSCLFSDKFFVIIKWKLRNSNCPSLDLDHPRTFNEKLNWLKLYDRNPLYTIMADKLSVKDYIRKVTNDQLMTAKVYGVYNKSNDIDFDILPNQFVLKCTHDSGSMIICKDKSKLDLNLAKMKLAKGLKSDFYNFSREWPYKNIEKRIIAEEFLENDNSDCLIDYKFWCFNGVPKLMYVTNKVGTIYENFYDMDFNTISINHGFPRHLPEFEKPNCFEEMKSYAQKLSTNIPFVRIDFWVIRNQVYFGEFTFYDWGGFQPFVDYKQDLKLGEWIKLPIE